MLSFGFGLLIGGVDWGWMHKSASNEVAFWSMLGGWLSGVATLFAVIVSLVLAFQASQNNTEQIAINVDPIKDNSGLTAINFKNLRSITTPLLKIYLHLDGAKDNAEINHLKYCGDKFPWTFQQLGESYRFEFYIDSLANFRHVYEKISSSGYPTFKKGHYIIETAMKRYKVSLPKDHLKRLKELYGN